MSESEQDRGDLPIESPGAALVAARKAQALELEAVAESTGVPRDVLLALESDDWERLDAPVYVRGYLRKYARLLGLDEEAILGAYEASAAPHDPAIRAHVTRGLGGHRDVRWLIPVTGLIVVVALILVGLWGWHHWHAKSSQALVPETAASAMMAPNNGPPAPQSGLDAAASSTQLKATASGSSPTPAVLPDGIHLSLQIIKPSWIEVYGTGHKRLYYNLAAAGTSLHFDTAKGPLSVFLGNASGVKIKLNGEEFEVPKADVTGKTARFELHLKKALNAGATP
ncbi:MAG: RodZ domain-containing protein [Gammaproteobacteria bacterium]